VDALELYGDEAAISCEKPRGGAHIL